MISARGCPVLGAASSAFCILPASHTSVFRASPTYLWERRRRVWGMFHAVSKLPRKSILGYLTMYPRINGQVSKGILPSKLAFSFFHAASLCLFPIQILIEFKQYYLLCQWSTTAIANEVVLLSPMQYYFFFSPFWYLAEKLSCTTKTSHLSYELYFWQLTNFRNLNRLIWWTLNYDKTPEISRRGQLQKAYPRL